MGGAEHAERSKTLNCVAKLFPSATKSGGLLRLKRGCPR